MERSQRPVGMSQHNNWSADRIDHSGNIIRLVRDRIFFGVAAGGPSAPVHSVNGEVLRESRKHWSPRKRPVEKRAVDEQQRWTRPGFLHGYLYAIFGWDCETFSCH